MNLTTLILRGYTAPYGKAAAIGDDLEQFAPGSFTDMLASPRLISLRWGSHDDEAPKLASTGRATLSLFEDDYGLAFEARLNADDRQSWGVVQSIVRRDKPLSLVSVGGMVISASRREKLLMGQTKVITAATIDHITICNNAAYRTTAVWPAHMVEDAPWTIQQLDARWRSGREAWNLKQAAQRRVMAKLRPIGRTVGGHVVMLAPNGMLRLRHGVTGRLIR